MAGAQGKNYTAQIATGSPPVLTTIDCQGDLNFDPGKALEISRTKGCKNPFFTEAGYTANFEIELATPMKASHTAILDNADNETLVSCAVVSSETGVPEWTGNAYVIYSPLTAPVEGIARLGVTIAWVDDPTRSPSV